jgi:hypothetical protein
MSVSSEELNLLVYRYLTEGGETYKTLPGLRSGAVCCVVCFVYTMVILLFRTLAALLNRILTY